jgi:hypothetical protein
MCTRTLVAFAKGRGAYLLVAHATIELLDGLGIAKVVAKLVSGARADDARLGFDLGAGLVANASSSLFHRVRPLAFG